MGIKLVSCLTGFIAAVALLFIPAASVAKDVKPQPGPSGTWVLIGSMRATRSADHDVMKVKGPYTDFRSVKFVVSNAPLRMQRMNITYGDGGAAMLNLQQNIPRGAESTPIGLPGPGRREVRKIEFWYQTIGGEGQSAVSVFGLR